MKIAFATSEELSELIPTERILAEQLRNNHIEVEAAVYSDLSHNWKQYDWIIVRSIWDYFEKIDTYLQWLELLEQSGVPVSNPVAVLRMNAHKFYLRDMAADGLAVIPTTFVEQGTLLELEDLDESYLRKGLVVKPAVSGGAFLTRLHRPDDDIDAAQQHLDELLAERDVLIQPFVPEIASEGELSLIFFNEEFSHAILKKAKADEFRVQQEYGGSYLEYSPSEELLAQARAYLDWVPEELLYARVDGVMTQEGFQLMELELIEPELFLNFGRGIDIFMQAILSRISSKSM